MYTLLSPLPSAIINTLIQVAYGFTIIRRYTFDVYLNVTHEITMNKDIVVSILFPQYDWSINCREWHVDIAVLILVSGMSCIYPTTLRVLAPLNMILYNILQCLHTMILARVLVYFSMTRSQII